MLSAAQPRHRSVAALLAVLALLLAFAPSARAAFGFESLAVSFIAADGSPATQAGSHPAAWTISLAMNAGAGAEVLPDGSLKDLRIQLPPGLVGTPGLLPQCSHSDFLAQNCPAPSMIGRVGLHTSAAETEGIEYPVYNVAPLPGRVAELGFTAASVPVVIELQIAGVPPYNLVASIVNASQAGAFFGSTLTIQGISAEAPFLTLPRSCAPASTYFEADSWEAPGAWVGAAALQPLTPTGCSLLGFTPRLRVQPTTADAGAPSGLELSLELPDGGLIAPTGVAEADLAAASLSLPPQMTISPTVAAGLAACTPADLARETPASVPGEGCPPAAKIGTATVTTPLLERPLTGTLFVAAKEDPTPASTGAGNPDDTGFLLYLVLRDPERGVLLNLPIRIAADPASGQLTADVTQIPDLPLSHLSLRFNSGPRAPLTTPPGCGSHAISYSLTPSSGGPPVAGQETFSTTSGCDTAFAPQLSVGTTSTAAGSAPALIVELGNDAGAPNLSGLHLALPPGLAADLSAAATCPEDAVAADACPPSSRLGFARIAIGAGPEPLWVPGGVGPDSNVYLAGPYRGAPFSLVVSVPAVAGPFDLGIVVLRAPVRIDPVTGRLSIDLAELPQIRDGVPFHYRTIRLVLDRPGFVRNPTSCDRTRAELTATAANGVTAGATSPFQAAGCGALGFRPRLALRFSGHPGRNGHPRIDLEVRPRGGDANLRAATFDLPPGELLDTRRLGALCPRNLPAESCPVASHLGLVNISSPLLPEPLSGPVILHAPSGSYPDFAVEVSGDGLHLRIHGRVGSAPGGRLRIRLEGLPDIALSKASISLAGGRRGIVVNSAPLCAHPRRAAALLVGQNGKEHRLRPKLRLRGRC